MTTDTKQQGQIEEVEIISYPYGYIHCSGRLLWIVTDTKKEAEILREALREFIKRRKKNKLFSGRKS